LHSCRSQWPCGLRRRSAAARLLRFWVRIPPGAGMFICCECCALSDRGLCEELITHPEESYWLWCVVVCDLETWWMRRPWPTGSCRAKNKQNSQRVICILYTICTDIQKYANTTLLVTNSKHYLMEAILMCLWINKVGKNPSNTPCLFICYCWIGYKFRPCRVIIRPLCEPSNV
jgi:hypothetical protein